MKINFDADSYKVRFLGGARQYLFYALFSMPPNVSNMESLSTANVASVLLSPFGFGSSIAGNYLPYLVKSTSVPESTFEEITIPFPGHPFKMAGQRSYADWQITFNVDEKGRVLKDLNNWHDLIYDASTNTSSSPNQYMRDQHLFLVDGLGEDIVWYKLINAWPKAIGAVGLDYASSDIATVDVSFSYQYYITQPTTITGSLLKTVFNKLLS